MSFITTLSYNDKTVEFAAGKMTFFDELYVDYKIENNQHSTRIQLMIHPKEAIVIQSLTLVKQRSFDRQDKIFCNGFQSSSESKEFEITEKIPQVHFLAKPFFKGDAHFDFIKRGKGLFHSWTYGFIRHLNSIEFIGSLNESTAFTAIQYDTKQGKVSIEKDCKGLHLAHSFPILDIYIESGSEARVFENYFNALQLPALKAPPLISWCSEKEFGNNSTDAILKNVAAFEENNVKFDLVMVGEGYQNNIGDWLQIKDDFPNGMGKLAQQIQSKGMKAGIWLAPFVCESKSAIFQHKKHWLQKDKKGKLLEAGNLRSLKLYALDFYQKEVQDYLLGVLKTMIDKWNFDLVHIDFLYAACLQPPPNKTRGQMMHDALQFIRSTIGNKWLTAANVPLGTAFGKVEYCFISNPEHQNWEARFLNFTGNRERSSAVPSLRSALSRWQLNGKAFYASGTVISLATSKSKLNPNQQFTILIINTLLGSSIYTKDAVTDYSPEQWAELMTIHHWQDSRVQSVEWYDKDIYLIRFEKNHLYWICACNLTNKSRPIYLGKVPVTLEEFESIILKK